MRYIRSDILERKRIRPGDTLIEAAGGTKDQPTGRTVLIKNKLLEDASHPLVCASFSRLLRPNVSEVDPNFLFWKLQDEYAPRRMLPYHIQHTGVARFQYTQFAENFPLYLPTISIQRSIAAVLSALDDKIELNRRMNETLEASARALFRDWFVDFGPTRAKAEGRPAYLAPDPVPRPPWQRWRPRGVGMGAT
ncbi:restriction endonuclease subunit S [Sphingomonas sp. Leaf67]|uniref:restriction endonuclease subunit S n=1 Tax=Sphingomonas sp. Leaf67 TaxID=1736230 RepID=UPI001F261C38|nr:restriction endonuclease subunit S [Sphingomonas sp. Leaf67]